MSDKQIKHFGLVGSPLKAESVYVTPRYQPSFQFPFNPDPLASGNDYSIYDEMRVDDQVKASLALKKNFVLCSGWRIVCENPEIAEDVETALNQINDDDPLDSTFNEIMRDMLSSYDYGFSISEPVFKLTPEKKFTYKSIKVRPPHSFQFEIDEFGTVLSIVQESSLAGNLTFKPDNFLHHIYQPEFGNPFGRSDLQSAYQPWKTKKFVERFLAIYLERFATPTVVGKYKDDLDGNEVTRFHTMLKTIQNATALAIPESTVIEFIQSSKDSSDAYLKALDYFNQRISRSLLVPDLIGVGGASTKGGSFALGKKHFEVFMANIAFDRKCLEKRITNKIVKPFVSINHGDDIPCSFEFLPPTSDDIIDYAKTWIEAVKTDKFEPTDEEINYLRKTLGFPESEIVERPAPVVSKPIAPNDDPKIAPPDELVPIEDQEDDFTVTFRDKNDFEAMIDFKEINKSLNQNEKNIGSSLKSASEKIYQDFINQIKTKGILKRFSPEKIKKLEPRFLKDMNNSFKNGFIEIFNSGQKQAVKELFPDGKKFQADLLPEEIIDLLKVEAFKSVGDYSTGMSKKTTNVLIEAVREGQSEAEVLKLLNSDLDAFTKNWLSTVIRTKTTSIYNQGRRAFWENDEIAKEIVVGYEFSAVLDSRTSQICSELDGKIFDVNDPNISRVTPSLHFNCRSLLVPITRFQKHTKEKVPSLKKVNDNGGTLKTFQLSNNLGDFITEGTSADSGDYPIIANPGDGRRLRVWSIQAMNISSRAPVNVSFKENENDSPRFQSILDHRSGEFFRSFEKGFALSVNHGFFINLSADVQVSYSIEYSIEDAK